jgi:hypothetical protein
MAENTNRDDPVTLVTPVARCAQIQGLRVLRASMKQSEEVAFPLNVQNHIRTHSRVNRENSIVVGVVALEMLAHRVEKETDGNHAEQVCESDPVIEVSSEYLLTYHVPGITAFSDEQLNAFGCVNGLYNAWPYWREHVQSSIARMGLPPFVVPVLTVAELQKMEKTSDGTFSMSAADEEPE